MKTVYAVLLGTLALSFTGCATSGLNSPTGYGWIADHKDPLLVTNNPTGSKTGKACSKSYLGFIALGDSSVDAAKKAGNISKVSTVDIEYTNIIGVYGSACTIVKGE